MQWIELTQTRQLLVDDHVIENMGGAKRVIHSWKKEEHPALIKELDWEGIGPYAMNRVALDAFDGKYKMWYSSYDSQSNRYNTGYAESKNGLHWERRLEGIPEGEMGAVVLDPGAPSGDCRYLSVGYRRPEGHLPGRATFYRSRDGFNWENFAGSPWWQGPSDVIDLLWDSTRECFVSYHKLWRVTGKTLEGKSIQAYFATFLPKQDMDKHILRIEGEELFPEIRSVSYELLNQPSGHDDGGGGAVSDDVAMLRVIGRAESKDFIHWTDHKVVFEPSEEEAMDVQYYGMPVVEYENVYLAFPRYHEGISGRIEVQFASSRDGVAFTMLDPRRVLACGEKGSWDGGMVFSTADILEIEGKLCMYYGAMNGGHTVSELDLLAATGRAWLRKDGFASLTGGTVLTKLLQVEGHRLYINAEGNITIRLLNSSKCTIGSAMWEGDSTKALVEWQSGGIIEKLVYLEFDLSQGNLYSFWTE